MYINILKKRQITSFRINTFDSINYSKYEDLLSYK